MSRTRWIWAISRRSSRKFPLVMRVITATVLGLVLAVISLVWQVITYACSGSRRVQVAARFGAFPSEMLPGRVALFLNPAVEGAPCLQCPA